MIAPSASFVKKPYPAPSIPASPAETVEGAGDYLVPLPGGQWNLWRDLVLRGTGFPASLVTGLAGSQEPAAADRYTEAVMARRRLPESAARRRAAYAELERACDADRALVEQRVRDLLADRRFREALVWQSPGALSTLDRRVSEGLGRPTRRREAMRRLALRAQRYAVKNDSIGFFGPVGWASFVDVPEAVHLRPGPDLVAERAVYFEGWCIDALARRLNEDPDVQRWAAPRLRAGVWFSGEEIYVPLHGPVSLTPREREIVRLCDGRRTAAAIAERHLAAAPPLVGSEEEVFDCIRRLVDRQILTWCLEVGSQCHPERELAERLARIGDPRTRACALTVVETLGAARDRVAAAAGDPDALVRAMSELQATFTDLTGQPPSRRPGKTYGARGLVYEDCRRGCELAFGTALLERLGPPLSIVLDAARWITHELGAACRPHLRRMLAELRMQKPVPDAHTFVSYVEAEGGRAFAAVCREIAERYQAAWTSVLGGVVEGRHLTCSVADVAARARETFTTRGTAWTRVQYFSPDLMVMAADVEAFRRGEFHCVLGELHGMNTLLASALTTRHPQPGKLAAMLTRDTRDETVVVRQTPKELWLARTDYLALPTYWRYDWVDDTPPGHACRSLPAAALVPIDEGSTVVLRARDGSVAFDSVEVFDKWLNRRICEMLDERLPRAPHMPRVTIGDLTIAREAWYVAPADMPFLQMSDPYAQFAAVREWARRRGMPRHVFYKSPLEVKPCYLDFSSRLYVEVFVSMIRLVPADGRVRIVEMLPGLEDLWLHDAEGRRYTCELRMTARRATAVDS